MSYEEESIPTFNRADSHPDAPPRRPIFANSDFAEIGSLAVRAAPVESSEGLRLPKTHEPLDEADLDCDAVPAPDRMSVGKGKRWSVCVDFGVRSSINKKKKHHHTLQ